MCTMPPSKDQIAMSTSCNQNTGCINTNIHYGFNKCTAQCIDTNIFSGFPLNPCKIDGNVIIILNIFLTFQNISGYGEGCDNVHGYSTLWGDLQTM